MKSQQLAVRVPDHLVAKVDKKIEGIRYRSRAQVIAIACLDWLETHDKHGNLTKPKKWTARHQ